MKGTLHVHFRAPKNSTLHLIIIIAALITITIILATTRA
jgi:hypothetical protein